MQSSLSQLRYLIERVIQIKHHYSTMYKYTIDHILVIILLYTVISFFLYNQDYVLIQLCYEMLNIGKESAR